MDGVNQVTAHNHHLANLDCYGNLIAFPQTAIFGQAFAVRAGSTCQGYLLDKCLDVYVSSKVERHCQT
jgi:hypothetical protein